MDILRHTRYISGIALTLVFLLHVAGILSVPLLNSLENQSYDARLKLMLPRPAEKQVVIIDIDEQSLAELGHWPWKRNILANIVDNLFDHYQIKAIGFDIVFAEADEDEAAKLLEQMASGPLKDNRIFVREYSSALNTIQRDARFARSLEKRNTTLGFVMDTDAHKGMLPEPVAILDESITGLIPFIRPAGYTANLEILQAGALNAGFIDNPLLDDDGVFRRIPLLQEYEGALHESLALALARMTLGSPEIEFIVKSKPDNTNELFLEWLKIGDILIPVDEHAGILVPYVGKQKSFTYIAASDILNKTTPIHELRGKTALFGTSAPGLHDLRTTPLEAAFPGVEIHANIIQGILDQTLLHQPAYTSAVEFTVLLILGLMLTILLPRLSPLSGLMVASALLFLLIAGNLALWNSYRFVFPIASPVLLVILMFSLQMTYGFFVETRGKRRLAHLFGQYVPPELVAEMSLKMEDIHLDGEIRDMTVLFSDVRNFTTLSESMAPRQITRLINGFLTPMTEVIHQQRGTIDKYMGDAIMAFWGAPLEDHQHALHALTAALNMMQRIQALKPQFAAQGWPDISIGIGINSGEMNVGNKGSEFRVDYTVLGDAVNLGSRLESLTRIYGVDIIVGENTRNAVPQFEYRELDRVRVKGKHKPVIIYEPLGLIDSLDKSEREHLERFHRGLKYYRERQWDEAEREIAALSHDDPHRKVYRIYLDRISQYRKQPPADDWDGSFTHVSK